MAICWHWRNAHRRGHERLAAMLAVCGANGLFADGPAAKVAEVRREAPADLTATLEPILKKHKIPGLIGAIVVGNEVTAIGAVGIRKEGAAELMTTGDEVHLGSDTKAMTAVLIAQLIEKKRLRFNTTMAEAFPNLAPGMNASMAKVTSRQLLDHTAGLPANPADWWSYDRMKVSLREQRHALVRDMLAAAPLHPPGERYEYSNVGFVILGAVLERELNLPWEEIIKDRIFEPLQMKSAGFGPPGRAGLVEQPWGHTVEGGRLKPIQFDNAPVPGPAGRVHCSMQDWAKFIGQFLEKEPGEKSLLKPEILRELITPAKGADYAGGWMTMERKWGGGAVLTHAGSNTMWYCVAWVATKKGFAVLAETNVAGDDAAKACDDAAAALIGVHEGTNERGK